MTNNYKYNSINLNNLITDININVNTSFVNIITGINTDVIDLKTMEIPENLKYTENNIDISTKARAKNIVYDSTGNTYYTVGLTIPGTALKYNYFTAYVAGGNGGGGGAGGDAETNGGNNVSANTSVGGIGGTGGYVALTGNIFLGNNNLYVTVGSAGNGGTRGPNDNSPGQNGSPGQSGNAGGSSYINIGNSYPICTGYGGGGGLGGGGANSGGGNGNTGANGTQGITSLVAGYTGNTTYNPSNNPPITLTGGIGGDNINSPQPARSVGGAGNDGYVRIYLKYIPP